MGETTLDKIEPGKKIKIQSVDGDHAIRKRLLEMGMTTGAVVEVERLAPLGDPVEIKIRGYNLSIRKDAASHIKVTLVE